MIQEQLDAINILTVDDDPDTCELLPIMLKTNGDRFVRCVPNEKEARNLLGWADLVVLDGSVTGFDQLVSDLIEIKLPFIVFSGSKFNVRGAVASVAKPNWKHLQSVVDKTVEELKNQKPATESKSRSKLMKLTESLLKLESLLKEKGKSKEEPEEKEPKEEPEGNDSEESDKDDEGEPDAIREKIIQFFTDNPFPEDDKVHEFAKGLEIEPDDLETHIYALLSDLLNTEKETEEPVEPTEPEMEESKKLKEAVALTPDTDDQIYEILANTLAVGLAQIENVLNQKFESPQEADAFLQQVFRNFRTKGKRYLMQSLRRFERMGGQKTAREFRRKLKV